MPNTLGRDQVWTNDIWSGIDQAVEDEVGRIRVVQKAIPSVNVQDAPNVPAAHFEPDEMTMAEGVTKPMIEISVEFSLTSNQVTNEQTQHSGQSLARLAAKKLALAEDTILLRGAQAELPKKVTVQHRDSAGGGLLSAGTDEDRDRKKPMTLRENPQNNVGEEIFKAVTQGIAELTRKGQPGPYALILESGLYADAFTPTGPNLVTAADRLVPSSTGAQGLLQGGLYGTSVLPKDHGLLISLGGDPTTIYVGTYQRSDGQTLDAMTAYTGQDEAGRYRFRVYERIQFVTREKSALLNLAFERVGEQAMKRGA
jgi:uncharacterized linocin/CFP29 family protein